jgi:hypothetical protein
MVSHRQGRYRISALVQKLLLLSIHCEMPAPVCSSASFCAQILESQPMSVGNQCDPRKARSSRFGAEGIMGPDS